MEIPKLTPIIQFATASFALAIGGYTAGEKFGWFKNDIIAWAPEHFRIEPAKIGQPITVTVARIKKRDDCSVEGFNVTVRDGGGRLLAVAWADAVSIARITKRLYIPYIYV